MKRVFFVHPSSSAIALGFVSDFQKDFKLAKLGAQ